MAGRRKLWGWGYERDGGRRARAGRAGRPRGTSASGRLRSSIRRRSRRSSCRRRGSSRRRRSPPICRSDPFERATHAYGKAYRDVVRALARALRPPARRRRAPRRRGRARAACSTGAPPPAPRRSPTAAARAWSAGSSRACAQDAGGDDRPGPARPGARGRRRLARRPHPGGRHRARPRGAAQATRADAAPLPAVVRVLARSAAGSPRARAGTSPRCTRTSTTSSSRCGRSRRAASGRAGGCPARAPGRARTACCSARRASSA